jgi:flavin-binding protein dodecin
MSVARVTEITSESTRSFEDAIKRGVSRANQTLRNLSGAWIKEQQIVINDGKVSGYRVNMLVTFILDDAPAATSTATRAATAAPARKAAAPARKAPARKRTPRRAAARRR